MAFVSLVCASAFLVGVASAAAPKPTYLSQWGTTGSGDGEFSFPNGVAIDAGGDVYVADSLNHRIQRFDGDGAFVATYGSFGAGDGEFFYPTGLAFDSIGNAFVADSLNNRIQKFDPDWNFLMAWGTLGTGNGEFDWPTQVGIDAADNVYVADSSNNRIQKFDANGAFLTTWGSLGTADGQMDNPGLGVAPSGDVYVADYANNRVQRFDSSGTFLTSWGSLGSGEGEMDGPNSVTVDAFGRVFVPEYFGDRVQVFERGGAFLCAWGTFGSGDGEFAGPLSVGINTPGQIYVVEGDNDRIQKFGPLDSDASAAINKKGRHAGPSASGELRRGATATFEIHVRNDGACGDRFAVEVDRGIVKFPPGTGPKGPVPPPSWNRFYLEFFDGQTDVSAQVQHGTFLTPVLAPGEQLVLTAPVSLASKRFLALKKTWNITATSSIDPAATDGVRLIIRSVR